MRWIGRRCCRRPRSGRAGFGHQRVHSGAKVVLRLFGLKPTDGRLSRVGTFPVVASLDHVGTLARSVGDLALSYDAMLGPDGRNPARADMPAAAASPTLKDRVSGLCIARLGGYCARSADPSATSAVDTIVRALKAYGVVELAQAEQACSAAYLITMVEGAALHLAQLRDRAQDFDSEVRDRLIAGAMVPGVWASGIRSPFSTILAADYLTMRFDASKPAKADRVGA